MDYQSVRNVILKKLEEKLPSYLVYHNASHTSDVIHAAKEIARAEKINGDDLTLLLTAALFHDSGYIFGSKGHEQKSCEIAEQYLPLYGYSNEQISRIKKIIMATKVPQSPQNHLGEILADADLDYLGRDDFFTIDKKLFEELKLTGVLSNEDEWNRMQERFLESHSYFTETAKQKRRPTKLKNLQLIKSLIK
ncbi:MAG: HD domain-containing protein [Chitinophagaceae bacterium]|nr:HD domain-containing protein [Chitinophagaceae bacterium]